MNHVRLILQRAARLLEDSPTMGPQLSVEQALAQAHRQVSKYWGHLPIAKAAIIDQLRLENRKLTIDDWRYFTGEQAKQLAPVMRAAAHLQRDDEEDDWL